MDNIQIFSNNEFGEIRTVIIDNEPFFVGNDCAKALGYKNLYSGISKNVDEDDRRLFPVGSTSGTQDTTIINESGLYSLIFGSKLESAKKFKKWVTSEVLPSIRKTGSYGQQKSTQEQILLLAQGTTELYQRMDKVSNEVQTVKADMENIKQDLPLFPSEADEIRNAINKRVIMLLGGKEFNSYKDKSLRKKVFTDCYQNLKHNFGDVTTYKAIKRGQKVQALQIIAEYKPPLFLTKQIELVNAQQVLDI